MPCWNKFGINYKPDVNMVASDIAYFKSIGLNKVRIHIPSHLANKTELDYWKNIAQTMYEAGFYTIYGVTAANTDMTIAGWQTYRTNVLAYAQECLNGVCNEFQVGNELERWQDDLDLKIADLRNNVRSLATEVKQIWTNKPISYSVAQSSVVGYSSKAWTLEGKGDLDLIGLNTYNRVVKRSQGNFAYFTGEHEAIINTFISAFGNSGYISEFNIEAGSDNYAFVPGNVRTKATFEQYKFIKSSGISSAYLYQYCPFKGVASNTTDFNLVDNDRTLHESWQVFCDDWGSSPKRLNYIDI